MKPWVGLAAAIAAIALLIGAYAFGRSDGGAIEREKRAAADRAVEADRRDREQRVGQVAGAAAVQETQRQQNVREIYRESHTVTERPVYRNVCVDADGLRILDRAAATANGEDLGSVSAGAGENPGPTPQR